MSKNNNSPLEGCPQGGVDSNRYWQQTSLFPYWKLPKNKSLSKYAKDLRRNGILSEVLFWQKFKDKSQLEGFDIDRQVIIGNYIVDFFIPELGLVIEIDGVSHEDKISCDKKRNKLLQSLGIELIHYLDKDIKRNIDRIHKDLCVRILERVKALSKNTPPRQSMTATPQEGNLAWSDILSEEKQRPYFKQILQFLENERNEGKIIFPAKSDIFNAFKYTGFENLKVVILGQDPYHNYNQAHGLAFSVQKGDDIPPSLRNIYKELARSIDDFAIPNHGCLEDWARQGVFLLNTTLTVEAHKANSHKDVGWDAFTDRVISLISQHKQNVVFMLWGGNARKKKSLIDKSKHLILESSHPSPLSVYRGFDGCDHFNECNNYLSKNNLSQIDWKIG